ncbi:hypothetical protein ACFL2X_07720 [Candidatus Latescibacterota bacterium]
MKEFLRTIMMILLIMLFTSTLFADSTVVKFSNPSKPGLIKVLSGNGDIKVTGYNGSDVIIDVDTIGEDVKNPTENGKSKGLKRISGSSVNVTHIKDENTIEISWSIKQYSALTIKVPFNSSFITGKNGDTDSASILYNINIQNIVMNSVFGENGGGSLSGNIEISNISGDIEASTMDGDITLTGVSGVVLANTMGGDIEVVFKEYKRDKSMSFSAMSGEIDVTLPPAVKVDIKAKNIEGEVLTDFDIEMIPVSTEVRETGSNRNAGFNLGAMLGNNIYGKINGGGPEIRFTTIDGDIYVRKGK